MSLEQKYLKYKSKYFTLKEQLKEQIKKQLGGECDPVPTKDYQDPINLQNLLDNPPEYRITVNGNCYDIRDIYKWNILQGKSTDPATVRTVAKEDIDRIIETYNKIKPLTIEEETGFINIINNRLKFNYHNAGIRVTSNKNVTLAFVRRYGFALQYASSELKADKDVVLAAVQQNGLALQDASLELRDDKEVVIAAVRQNGLALRYASSRLIADKEVVLAAEQNTDFLLVDKATKIIG